MLQGNTQYGGGGNNSQVQGNISAGTGGNVNLGHQGYGGANINSGTQGYGGGNVNSRKGPSKYIHPIYLIYPTYIPIKASHAAIPNLYPN